MMVRRVRKQFRVTPEQDRELKRLAKQMGTTVAEVIRQALHRHIRALEE